MYNRSSNQKCQHTVTYITSAHLPPQSVFFQSSLASVKGRDKFVIRKIGPHLLLQQFDVSRLLSYRLLKN